MRILICMTAYCPWSQTLAARLQSFGNEVHVVDFSDNEDDGLVSKQIPGIAEDFQRFTRRVSSVRFLRAPTLGNLRYVIAAPRLRLLAESLRIDLVLTLYGGGFALMAYLSGFRPYCVYVVGSDVLKATPTVRRINARVLPAAERVFANGEYLASRAREQAPEADIQNLLIGVDLDGLELAQPEPGPIQFINTRGFMEVYNNPAILEAIARIPVQGPDFRMVFASGGSLLEEAKALADRILPPAHRRRVEFWGGVARERLLEGLRRAHVFVSASRSDGTSTSLLEALACGLFAIVSDIPQNHEWIGRDLAAGALVPPDDHAALARRMEEAMTRAQGAPRLGHGNRALVAAKADARRNHERLMNVLGEVAAARPRRWRQRVAPIVDPLLRAYAGKDRPS